MDCRTTGNIRSLMIASLVGMLLPAPGVSAAEPGDSRLADAVMKRDGAAVRALLGQKVDVNAPGKDGTPALHWSVREDDLATARLLLGAGADATLANRYGITPLFLACANGNEAMIRLLLDAGADPNSSDPTGETALMAAVRLGSSGACEVAARPRGDGRGQGSGVSADRADGGRPGESSRDREAAARPWRAAERGDPGRRHAGVDPAEFGAGIRTRCRHRAGRIARAGVAKPDSRRAVAAPLCRSRRPPRHRAHARRGRGG